jgi:hypothetical protein
MSDRKDTGPIPPTDTAPTNWLCTVCNVTVSGGDDHDCSAGEALSCSHGRTGGICPHCGPTAASPTEDPAPTDEPRAPRYDEVYRDGVAAMDAEESGETAARPGSEEARSAGCRCPVIDNHHGKGRGGDGPRLGWFVSESCPLHTTLSSPGDTERTCPKCGDVNTYHGVEGHEGTSSLCRCGHTWTHGPTAASPTGDRERRERAAVDEYPDRIGATREQRAATKDARLDFIAGMEAGEAHSEARHHEDVKRCLHCQRDDCPWLRGAPCETATLREALAEWGRWVAEHCDSGLTVPTRAVAVAMECALLPKETP